MTAEAQLLLVTGTACGHVTAESFDRVGRYRYVCVAAPDHDGPHRFELDVVRFPVEDVPVSGGVL